jgi:HPt (histidine-containing phosphotransfer) domain-containing protein
MDDYIAKPVRLEDLQAALERSREGRPGAGETVALEIPSFDPAVLGALRELQANSGADLVSELVEVFLADAPDRIAELLAALEPVDVAGLAHAAHALKGSAATLGVRRLAGLCAALEKQARDGIAEGAGAAVSEIEKEFENVRQVLLQQV